MGSDHNLLPQVMRQLFALGTIIDGQRFIDLLTGKRQNRNLDMIKVATFGGKVSQIGIEILINI